MSESEKGIVFCHTCNRIVGDRFPVFHHWHDFGNGPTSVELLLENKLGFGWYTDTPETRATLAKDYPPRDEITVRVAPRWP